jgi:hypothetical protein
MRGGDGKKVLQKVAQLLFLPAVIDVCKNWICTGIIQSKQELL